MELIDKFAIEDLWEIISTNISSDRKLKLMVDSISKFFGIEKCSLMVEKENVFKIVASVGVNKKIIEETEIQAGQGIAGLVVKEKKSSISSSLRVRVFFFISILFIEL